METRKFNNIGETLLRETLENGLAVNIVPKPGWNKSYAFFATDYGGADRRFMVEGRWTDTPAGVAHFLEHKMFDTPDGGNALSKLSSNGASPNAFTSQSMTAYHFESTQGFEDNLRTLLNFVSVPYFTAESVFKEQGIIGQEIRMMEDHPGYAVYMNLMKCLYKNSPVRDSVAGTLSSIAEITDKTLYDCHRVFYNPSNMVLCIAGDVDPSRIIDIAREALPTEPGPVPERDYGEEEPKPPASSRSDVNMAVSAPQFMIGTKVAPTDNGTPLLRQKLVGKIALSCLAGRSSPFYNRLYAEGLLNNDFSFELDYAAKTASVLIGGESRDPEKVMSELLAEVERISSKGIDEGLLGRISKAVYGGCLRGLDSFGGLCSEIAEGEFSGYCYLDALGIIKDVSSKEARAFICENMSYELMAMSVINPIN